MGMLPVEINDRVRIHVKDTAFDRDGCHLWMSLYVNGVYVGGDAGPVVHCLNEVTLTRAAHDWYRANRLSPPP